MHLVLLLLLLLCQFVAIIQAIDRDDSQTQVVLYPLQKRADPLDEANRIVNEVWSLLDGSESMDLHRLFEENTELPNETKQNIKDVQVDLARNGVEVSERIELDSIRTTSSIDSDKSMLSSPSIDIELILPCRNMTRFSICSIIRSLSHSARKLRQRFTLPLQFRFYQLFDSFIDIFRRNHTASFRNVESLTNRLISQHPSVQPEIIRKAANATQFQRELLANMLRQTPKRNSSSLLLSWPRKTLSGLERMHGLELDRYHASTGLITQRQRMNWYSHLLIPKYLQKSMDLYLMRRIDPNHTELSAESSLVISLFTSHLLSIMEQFASREALFIHLSTLRQDTAPSTYLTLKQFHASVEQLLMGQSMFRLWREKQQNENLWLEYCSFVVFNALIQGYSSSRPIPLNLDYDWRIDADYLSRMNWLESVEMLEKYRALYQLEMIPLFAPMTFFQIQLVYKPWSSDYVLHNWQELWTLPRMSVQGIIQRSGERRVRSWHRHLMTRHSVLNHKKGNTFEFITEPAVIEQAGGSVDEDSDASDVEDEQSQTNSPSKRRYFEDNKPRWTFIDLVLYITARDNLEHVWAQKYWFQVFDVFDQGIWSAGTVHFLCRRMCLTPGLRLDNAIIEKKDHLSRHEKCAVQLHEQVKILLNLKDDESISWRQLLKMDDYSRMLFFNALLHPPLAQHFLGTTPFISKDFMKGLTRTPLTVHENTLDDTDWYSQYENMLRTDSLDQYLFQKD